MQNDSPKVGFCRMKECNGSDSFDFADWFGFVELKNATNPCSLFSRVELNTAN